MPGSLWRDRLAEVWSPAGRAGVVVGEREVLTPRHVVKQALSAEGEAPQARVVRPGVAVGGWVPMRVVCEGAGWDVALLSVDTEAPEPDRWLVPASPAVVIAALGQAAEPGCEAIGFPQSERVEDGPPGGVRQTERAGGIVLPSGQGNPPRRPERALKPGRWLPLDVETATPGTQQGWAGMSGAGVVLPDGRLVGLVLTAESGHQERRLYFVPLAAVLHAAGGMGAALTEQTGRPEIAQARTAAVWEQLLSAACLGDDGLPRLIRALDDLGAFGVKAANVSGERPYLEYVPRDDDVDLGGAFDRTVTEHRMLLMVGGSATGKSRSAAELIRKRLGGHRLLRPQAGRLAALLEAPRWRRSSLPAPRS